MPETTPKLSIVLPVRNEGLNLRIMVRMLGAVVDAPSELIVVHDTPDDETVPVVRELQKRHPNLRLVHNQLGRGVTYALQAGIAAARGEYVLLFAADEVGPVLALEDML